MTQRTQIVTLSDVKKHNSAQDCWVVLHGKIYDVTAFLPEHPGGAEAIACLAGGDATDEFEEIGHSVQARKIALQYEIGVLEGHEITAKGAMANRAARVSGMNPAPMPGIISQKVSNSFNSILFAALIIMLAYFLMRWAFA